MGSIGRAHGIRGEMGVNWEGEAMPSPGGLVYLQQGDEDPAPWQVASSRIHNGRLLLSLRDVPDRTAAEKLTGRKIYLLRSAAAEPGEDEAFVADLPGCEVLLPNGELVGRLNQVDFPAGKMIWTISGPAGNEILFPAEPEFIRELDMDARKIVIDPPPGLLEIYSA